jgi:hypothetical protein
MGTSRGDWTQLSLSDGFDQLAAEAPDSRGDDISDTTVNRPANTQTDDYVDSPCPNNNCDHTARHHDHNGSCGHIDYGPSDTFYDPAKLADRCGCRRP